MDSILLTIKAALDLEADYDGFDTQIIMAINSAIFTLSQLGIGPEDGFNITGIDEQWSTLYAGVSNLEAIQSYILLRVRMEFDPYTTSFGVAAAERQLEQMEFRFMIQVDPEVETS